MEQFKTPQELIDFTLNIKSVVRVYIDMDYWTPAMGALLLAGLRPPQECTEIPIEECLGLDGVSAWKQRLRDAKIIFKEWTEYNEDEVDVPQRLSPYSFLLWCVDSEVQEQNSFYSKFPWIDIFKDAADYKSEVIGIPYKIAEMLEEYVKPLDTILAKLDDNYIKGVVERISISKNRSAVKTDELPLRVFSSDCRSFLRTEELAKALGIKSASIHKAYSSKGSYFGLVPEKTANRRLMWPLDSVERLKKLHILIKNRY